MPEIITSDDAQYALISLRRSARRWDLACQAAPRNGNGLRSLKGNWNRTWALKMSSLRNLPLRRAPSWARSSSAAFCMLTGRPAEYFHGTLHRESHPG